MKVLESLKTRKELCVCAYAFMCVCAWEHQWSMCGVLNILFYALFSETRNPQGYFYLCLSGPGITGVHKHTELYDLRSKLRSPYLCGKYFTEAAIFTVVSKRFLSLQKSRMKLSVFLEGLVLHCGTIQPWL